MSPPLDPTEQEAGAIQSPSVQPDPGPAADPLMPDTALPVAVLAELTHRCPMRCAYCSNPLQLDPVAGELDTSAWKDVLDQAAAMGVLQVHFSGGEPALRPDLPDLVAHAASVGLYSNLITSGWTLTDTLMGSLAEAGLDHVQLALQDIDDVGIKAIAGVTGGLARKTQAARAVMQADVALTLNLVITRLNCHRVGALIDQAHTLGAGRCEVANVQYYGWGLRNRAALIPSRAQLEAMTAEVTQRREQYHGTMVIDYVIPDYHASRPKACMNGWGRRFLNITPTGKVLPCHAAETIPDLGIETVADRPLAAIWRDGPAFEKYRGDAWMPEDCRSCERKTIDWGGCRCQALALTGQADAMDPVCVQSEHHDAVQTLAQSEATANPPPLLYRAAPPKTGAGGDQ